MPGGPFMPFPRIGLAAKLVLSLVVLSCLALGIMGVLTHHEARESLIEDGRDALSTVVETRVAELSEWAGRVASDLTFQSGSPLVQSALRSYGRGIEDMDLTGPGAPDLSATYQRADNKYRSYFEDFALRGGFADVLVFGPQGQLIFATARRDMIGEHVADIAPSLADLQSDLAASQAKEPRMSDILQTDSRHGAFAAVPIPGRRGDIQGYLAVEIAATRLEHYLTRTGDPNGPISSYLLGADGRPRIFLDSVPSGWSIAPEDPRAGAVLGERGVFLDDGEAAKLVAFAPLRIMGRSWGVITEQDHDDLVAVAHQLGHSTLIRGLWVTGGAALAAYLIALGMIRRIGELTGALGRLRKGQLSDAVPLTARRDELGHTARAIDALRHTLLQARVVEEENRRKSAALGTTSAALMMTDTDFNIHYVNASVVKLMSRRSADFATVDPEFDAHNLVGLNMDRFHRVPERVRALMSDPKNLPFHTDITVGEAAVQLHVDAITDDEGAVIGMVLEWIDVTDTRREQATLSAIETSMLKAEFSGEGVLERSNDNFAACFPGRTTGDATLIDGILDLATQEGGRTIVEEVTRGGMRTGRFLARAPGGAVYLDGGFYPIRDLRGRPSGVVFIASDVTEAHQAMEEADRVRLAMAEEQKQVVEALRVGLNAIASGDLSVRLRTPFAADHDQLRLDFNQSTEHLSRALQSVSMETGAMQQETDEIVNASDDLAKRTEKQAMTLQETASSLDELTQNVAATAQGAARANRLVEEARQGAESSGAVVVSAEHAMSEIAASSSEVVKVISVIDDIAFQTNLLAVSAGVDAARAGEAGRGFAVVATEVRALAQRCSDAAAEIGGLISRSGQHVSQGVDLVGQTGAALTGIVASIQEVADFIGEIARAGDEQSRALTQINGAVNQIDHATQQSAAMFEQTSAAAHGLAQRAQSLAGAIGQFSFDDSAMRDTLEGYSGGPSILPTAAVANGALEQGATPQDGWRAS